MPNTPKEDSQLRVNGPEQNDGNIEYKLYLESPSPDRLDRLVTQMRYRLAQGGGEAFYELGVSDNGELVGLSQEEEREALNVFDRVARLAGAEWRVTRRVKGRHGEVLEAHVRQKLEAAVQIVVPLLGNVDSGKSSLVGVLCTGRLDNGNGESAARVARYLHEIVNRRTSSVSTHLLGFDGSGKTVNDQLLDPLSESQVYLRSRKVAVLVDLAGHERYLRTTLKGVLGHTPDYALVVVASNMGTVGTFREHLGICVVLGIPFAVAVTKVDLDPYNVKNTLSDVVRVLKLPGVNKVPLVVDTPEDAVLAARHISSGRIAPIFLVSNVTGAGLDLLKLFLDLAPPRLDWEKKLDEDLLVYVDDKFLVKGVGLVVSGMLLQGRLSVNQEVYVGPFPDSSFKTARIKSMHVNRVSVEQAKAGQIMSAALAGVEYDEVEKGMVLLSQKTKPQAALEFKADVHVLYHPTTIKPGYQSVVHIYTHRQPARIISILGRDTLRTGDKGTVIMRFMKKPAYLYRGQTVIFREGRTKGIGRIVEVYPKTPEAQTQQKA
ncbi:MAG: GTP-binding protein [Thermoprotei archaeon]